MPYFLTSEELAEQKEFELSGEEARHVLLSHRVRSGQQVKVQDPLGNRFMCEVLKAGKRALNLKTLQRLKTPEEPGVRIALFQSAVSEKALEFILQKSTELGAQEVVLFNSSRTALRLMPEKFNAKLSRYEKIVWEAAKQCERVRPPKLTFVASESEMQTALKALETVLLLDPHGKAFEPHTGQNTRSIGIVVGPEGGFTEVEVQKFATLPNSKVLSLGPILLRAETAALAALSLVRFG